MARDVRTVIYVHGIGNKPEPSVLKCQWDLALFGVEMGDRTRMAYWVDRTRSPRPTAESCGGGDRVDIDDRPADEAPGGPPALAAIGERIARHSARTRIPGSYAAQLLPLAPPARRRVTRLLTRMFLRDVHDLLFDDERRETMVGALTERLTPGNAPTVIVAHSLGSVIAWEALRRIAPSSCRIPLLVTIGSPLGMVELQEVLLRGSRRRTMPVPRCVRRWVNVADRLDPVAVDARLENDFRPRARVEDHVGWAINGDAPLAPHSATGYLRSAIVRQVVGAETGAAFSQRVTSFVMARDLARRVEDGWPERRHPVLIEVTRDTDPRRVTAAVKRLVAAGQRKRAGVEPLERFVVARLDRRELEALRASCGARLPVHRVWRDAVKRVLLRDSADAVGAPEARRRYEADGRDVHWAVLDTGIREDHPHFSAHGNVAATWDCTRSGTVRRGGADGNGHGTHVAGIIAGEDGVAAIAPRTRIHSYKVLADDGSGLDSWIIKAIQHVERVNEEAGRVVIHGVNLSLGGPYDPSVHAAGHSPVARELKRLWRQGVVVVLAAGNEGYAVLQAQGGPLDANLDLTIGEPANLEESVAVGSVHKREPLRFGVSFFSSRGPTADGRAKPDVVAPGEKIVSARAEFADEPYVEMSGTSMAAPHVSGVIAAFLSARSDFIGDADAVKRVLVAGCADLHRDRYSQGSGLPDLMRMLDAT